MTDKKKYDSTVARIAGNIAGHFVRWPVGHTDVADFAAISVAFARAIVAEVERTEPVKAEG